MFKNNSELSNMRGSHDTGNNDSNVDLGKAGTEKNLSLGTSFKTGAQMPKQVNGNYYALEYSGIEIDTMTLDSLRDNFIKFMPEDAPGEQGDRLEPAYMKMQYEKLGLNRQNPSMYSMICWMTEAYNQSDQVGQGLSFDDFISQAVFFFSQRHQEEGLRVIFQLFDKDNKGITIDQFEEICESLDIYLSKQHLHQFFLRGSKDGKVINFHDFASVMRKENYK